MSEPVCGKIVIGFGYTFCFLNPGLCFSNPAFGVSSLPHRNGGPPMLNRNTQSILPLGVLAGRAALPETHPVPGDLWRSRQGAHLGGDQTSGGRGQRIRRGHQAAMHPPRRDRSQRSVPAEFALCGVSPTTSIYSRSTRTCGRTRALKWWYKSYLHSDRVGR